VFATLLIQVVHCHPLTDSYLHALLCTIVETLEKSGHLVSLRRHPEEGRGRDPVSAIRVARS
jgi:hypothetical protein